MAIKDGYGIHPGYSLFLYGMELHGAVPEDGIFHRPANTWPGYFHPDTLDELSSGIKDIQAEQGLGDLDPSLDITYLTHNRQIGEPWQLILGVAFGNYRIASRTISTSHPVMALSSDRVSHDEKRRLVTSEIASLSSLYHISCITFPSRRGATDTVLRSMDNCRVITPLLDGVEQSIYCFRGPNHFIPADQFIEVVSSDRFIALQLALIKLWEDVTSKCKTISQRNDEAPIFRQDLMASMSFALPQLSPHFNDFNPSE